MIELNHIFNEDCMLNGNFIKEWDSVKDAAEHYGSSAAAIRYACNGVTHSSCNRIWKYKD